MMIEEFLISDILFRVEIKKDGDWRSFDPVPDELFNELDKAVTIRFIELSMDGYFLDEEDPMDAYKKYRENN